MLRRWAISVGELDMLGKQLDLMTTEANTIRDQGAPEDVLEDLTAYLGALRQARKALADASRHLYTRVEER